MSHLHRARAAVGALVLAVGLGALSGCGGDDDKTGRAADEVSADTLATPEPGAGSQDSTSPGVPAATEGLPQGFPSEDVPLLSEEVLTGSAGDPDGEFAWSVVLQSSRAVSQVSADVRKDFADAGYTAGPGNEVGDLSVMQFTGPKYDVGVTAARTEGRVVITYVVRDVG